MKQATFGIIRDVEPTAGQALTSTLPPRIGRINTAAGVRKELAKLYKEARSGQVPVADASRLGALLAALARIIEQSDLECRVRALERVQQQKEPAT